MALSVAIVGGGPGGFYTAGALKKAEAASGTDILIDIIDRLPTPYGLIRAGVAPDHQSSKKIAKVFERTLSEDGVRYLGNVQVDRDLSVAELREIYDAVVLCTGAPADRALSIPGEDLAGVFGSAAFVAWYNAHPDGRELDPSLQVDTAVIIGNGNVALDVARLLASTEAEVRKTDMADHAQNPMGRTPIKDIYVIGRRGPIEAAFTHKELKEFGELENAVPLVDASLLPDNVDDLPKDIRGGKDKNLGYLKDYAANSGAEKPVRIHLDFYARPLEIGGDTAVSRVTLRKTKPVGNGRVEDTDQDFTIDCDLLVSCIGTLSQRLAGLPFDEGKQRFPNEDGKIEDGLYCAGWAKRGPSGTIATNNPDGVAVAEMVIARGETGKPGPDEMDALMADRNVRVTSFQDWKTIEAAEESAAEHGAPRRKFTKIEDMLAALG